ncbi:hypothetical protein A6024_14165 [Rhodovulum sulfidophilum]|nr:hypothetical protein A6W98_14300 [Rhodovulum sulfidophilum DSM 1374]ANB38965.1 hypothetical protein A6024_14165 [Rhodovulum sulfidophilum]
MLARFLVDRFLYRDATLIMTDRSLKMKDFKEQFIFRRVVCELVDVFSWVVVLGGVAITFVGFRDGGFYGHLLGGFYGSMNELAQLGYVEAEPSISARLVGAIPGGIVMGSGFFTMMMAHQAKSTLDIAAVARGMFELARMKEPVTKVGRDEPSVSRSSERASGV